MATNIENTTKQIVDQSVEKVNQQIQKTISEYMNGIGRGLTVAMPKYGSMGEAEKKQAGIQVAGSSLQSLNGQIKKLQQFQSMKIAPANLNRMAGNGNAIRVIDIENQYDANVSGYDKSANKAVTYASAAYDAKNQKFDPAKYYYVRQGDLEETIKTWMDFLTNFGKKGGIKGDEGKSRDIIAQELGFVDENGNPLSGQQIREIAAVDRKAVETFFQKMFFSLKPHGGSIKNNITGKKTVNLKNTGIITPQEMWKELESSTTFMVNKQHDPYVIGGMIGKSKEEINKLITYDIKTLDWNSVASAKLSNQAKFMPGFSGEVLEAFFDKFNQMAHNAKSDVDSEADLLLKFDTASTEVADFLNKMAAQAVADFRHQYGFSPYNSEGKMEDIHKDWFRGYMLKRGDMIQGRLNNILTDSLSGSLAKSASPTIGRDYGDSGFAQFTSQLSESRQKYFSQQGLGKRLEFNIAGIKPGTGSAYVGTSADRELASLFSWASQNGYVVMYEQIASGDTEKYQFYVLPQDAYNENDAEATKEASIKFDWVAPDELGRLTTGNLGSASSFFLDFDSGKYLDLNTWGLSKNISAIKDLSGKKSVEEINALISTQSSSIKYTAPLDFYGQKDYESLYYDDSQANASIATEEEKRRADSLMRWSASLQKYFENHPSVKDEFARITGVSNFKSWEVPQVVQDVLNRYLIEKNYNPEHYREAIEKSDDKILKEFLSSPKFAGLLSAIDAYFEQGGGYWVQSLSHGSVGTGKAFANMEADLPFTDMLAMQATASENTSKGKANSVNRKIANYESLLEKGWRKSSLRPESESSTDALVTASLTLPKEILQMAVDKSFKGKYKEGVTEERLFGDEIFQQSARFYGNSKKNLIGNKELNSEFDEYFKTLVNDAEGLNKLAIGETLRLNEDLNKKTHKRVRLTDKLSIPKNSYIVSVSRTEQGYEVTYIPQSDVKQAQKFVDRGTNQRHEFGKIKVKDVSSSIQEFLDMDEEERIKIMKSYGEMSDKEKKDFKKSLQTSKAAIDDKKNQIHTFMMDTSDKRSSSARTAGSFNEGYWEYLVNLIKNENQFKAIAEAVPAFAGRYAWDAKAKGVVSNLTMDRATGKVITEDTGEDFYGSDKFWNNKRPDGEENDWAGSDKKLLDLIMSTENNVTSIEEAMAFLPQYRAAVGMNIKTTSWTDETGDKSFTLGSMYDDVYKVMVELNLATEGMQRRLKLIAPGATNVAEYSGLAGTGTLDNGESQVRITTRLKENLRGNLEKLAKAGSISQKDMDAFMSNFDTRYKGEARDINNYNTTLSAMKNSAIKGQEMFTAVFGAGGGSGKLRNGSLLNAREIDISDAVFDKFDTKNNKISQEQYEKSVIGMLYNAVKAAGYDLGETAQVQLSFAGLDENARAALNAAGFYDGQILALTPEEIASVNSVNGVETKERQIGATHRSTLEYLRNAHAIAQGQNIEDRFAKKIVDGSGSSKASAYYEQQLKKLVVSGGDFYKQAVGRKAANTGNFHTVASADLEGNHGIISYEGALDLFGVGRNTDMNTLEANFLGILTDIDERQLKDKNSELDSLVDKDLIEKYNNAKTGQKKKIYTELLTKYIDTLSNNELELPGWVLRNPLLNESNVSYGMLVNSKGSSQENNVIMLPKLIAELLNADFDGDMIQVVGNLMASNTELGNKLLQHIKDAGIKTRQQLQAMGEWKLDDSMSNDKYALELIKQASALTDSEIKSKFTIGTLQGQGGLGLASYTNTDTMNNLRAARKIHGDENNIQYIQDEIFRTIASEIVEQQGISAKKTLDQILAGANGEEVQWDVTTLEKIKDTIFNYTGTKEQEQLFEKYKVKDDNAKLQYIIQSLRQTLGDEKVKATGLFDDNFAFKEGAFQTILGYVGKINREAQTKQGGWRNRYSIEKDAIAKEINPELIGRPGGYTGIYWKDVKAYGEEQQQIGALSDNYDEHSSSVNLAAEAEKAKLGVSSELAKKLGVESNVINELTSSYDKLTDSEKKNANSTSSRSAEINELEELKEATGEYIAAKKETIKLDADHAKNHATLFSVGDKSFGVGDSISITKLIGTREFEAEPPREGSPQDLALKKSSAIGTYGHRLLELMGKYQQNSLEELLKYAEENPTARVDGESFNLSEALENAQIPLKNVLGIGFNDELLKSIQQRASLLFKIASKEGIINHGETQYETVLAGKFANSSMGVTGIADVLDDSTYSSSDWKISADHSEETAIERILQQSAYQAMHIQDLIQDAEETQKLLDSAENNEDKEKLQNRLDALNNTIEGYKEHGTIHVLAADLDSNGEAFAEVITARAVDYQEMLKFLENNHAYREIQKEIDEIEKIIQSGSGTQANKDRLAQLNKMQQAMLSRGLGGKAIASAQRNFENASIRHFNTFGEEVQTGEQGANFFKKGGGRVNKSVNDYIRTYKMLLKAQEDVQRAEIKSQGKSGNDLINAQALVKAAKDREILLQSQLGTLDLTAMTLNGEKLTEEQIIKLKREIGRADASHLAKQAAITASVREEQGFLQKLVGGFKQRITGFIDTSLAYQAIGRIRSAINQLIQTTVQLDAALVDIQIATGNTRKETRDLMISYSSLAKEMGRTTVEVTQASNDWLRAGYEGQEAAELTRASMMLSTLGMIEASQATTYLISTLKGWKLEASEVIGVVDKLSAVDMSAAISAGDLALAMSRANNSARLAGVDMNKFIGYVTTVADVTQKSAESVGESFKTIFSRFGNVKAGKFVASYEDTQSADYSEDEWTNLNDIETVLGRIGIKIRENAKDWRNVDDILSEIGEKWATWDKTTQNAVATAIAGTRQRENVLTLFANWDDVSKYAEIAENAYGTATEKMEAYTQSVEASKNRMTVAIENWALSLNQSDTIKAFYDSLTFIVENIHTLALAFGGLAAALNIKSVANFFGSTWTKFGKKMIDMSNLLGKARQGYQSSRGFMGTAKENLQNYAQQRDIAYFSDELEAKYHDVLDKEILAKVQLLQSDLFGVELKDRDNVAILLSTEATEEATIEAWNSISKKSALTLATALLNTATEEERQAISNLILKIQAEEEGSVALAAAKKELADILEKQKSSGALQGGVGGFVGKNIQTDNSYAKQMATGIGATIGMMAGGFAGKTFSSSFAKAVNLDSDTFGIVGTMIGSSIGMAIGPKIMETLMSGGGLSAIVSNLGPWGIAAGVAIAAGAALGISQKMDAKALERAQNAFKESENNLNEAKGAQKLAKQFDELSAGVDRFGNNVSLSEEDYDKFLEISNQLGGIFPELIRYTDEEGNKIIGASDGVKNLSSEVSTLYDNLVKIADLDLLQDANVNDAISKAHNDIKDYENDIIKLQVERDQVEKFGGIPTGDYSISTGKMNFSRVFDTEEEKAHYIAELDSQIDNIQNKINKVPQQLQSYVQAILRQEVEGYDELSDEARQALQLTLNNISLDGIQTIDDLEDRVQEMALKVQKTFKENPALISLISDTYEAETVGELMEARESLMAQLSQVFGADGWDDTEKKILIAWGFKYDEESGDIFDSQNLGSQIQQALMGQGMSEQGAATWMARTGITNRSVDEGQKIFGYINSGAVNWNTSGRVLDNLINSDSYGGGTLQGALDYSQSLAESTVGIREQLHEFYSNIIEDGEVTRAAVTNAFSTVPENVRESIYQSSESLLEQFDTVEEASEAMEEEISDNFANISESLLNSQKEVASQMAARSFSNIDRGEDNIIGEWSEIAQMLDQISTSYDKLGTAQQEQAIAGRLSWETTLDLLNTNIDYLHALEVTEEGIKLKTNAEEIMSEVQLQAAKANIEAKIAELEAENLRLQEIIAGVNVTDAAAMATVTSNNMVIESLNDVNQAWAQATEYARTYWQVAEGDTEAQVADVVAKRMKISNVVSSDKLKILGKELNVKGKDIDREQEWIAPSERPSTNWTTEQKDAFHKLQDNLQSIATLKRLLTDLDTIIDNGGSGWDKLMRAPSGSGGSGGSEKEDDPEDYLKRLKAAIGALNKEYEQMIAYQKEEGKLIPGTAAEMRKKYYEQLNGLLQKQAVELLKLAAAQKDANGNFIADENESTLEAEQKHWEYMTDYEETIVKINNLDDEEINDVITMIEAQGILNDNLIKQYQLLLDASDTLEERIENQEKLNKKIKEQKDLAITLLQFERELLDYRLQYLEASPGSDQYNQIMEQERANLQSEMGMQRGEMGRLYQIAYDKVYQNYIDNGYTDAVAREKAEYEARQDKDFQSATKSYIAAYQKLGELAVKEFEDKINVVQKQISKLQDEKPKEWAGSWSNGSFITSAFDKINAYYDEANKLQNEVLEEAQSMLDDVSDLTDKQIEGIVDKANSAIKAIHDNAIQRLEDTKQYQESTYNALVNEVNRYIKQIEKQKEIVEDAYDKELEKLQDKEDAIERTNKLLSLQNNLQNAQQERQRVFRQGIGWVNKDAHVKEGLIRLKP